MKFLTGDDTGLIKWVRVEAQKVDRFGSRKKGDAVLKLCWAGPPSDRESAVAIAYASGDLELRESATGQVISSAKTEPGVKCLQVIGSGVLAISADGTCSVVAEWGQATEGKSAPVAGAAASVRQFKIQGPVGHACVDPNRPSRFAFGGLENDVKIYDMEKEEVTWTAKNVRENFLCLRVPVKISLISWATKMCPSRSLLLCGTVDGKVRVYDANAQRRPLFELQIGFGVGAGTGGYTGTMDDTKRPVNCGKVAQVRGNSWGLFIGDTMGVMREYDLMNLAKTKGVEVPPGRKSHLKLASKELPFKRGYRGIMGSVRDVDVHASGEALVAVGLGRFAYVFGMKGRDATSKVYLKQKLCCVLMSSEAREKPKEDCESEEEEDNEDDEELDGDEGEDGEEELDDLGDEVEEGFSDDGEGGDEEKCEDEDDGEDEEEEQAPSKAKKGSKGKKILKKKMSTAGKEDVSKKKKTLGSKLPEKQAASEATTGSSTTKKGKRKLPAAGQGASSKKKKGRKAT